MNFEVGRARSSSPLRRWVLEMGPSWDDDDPVEPELVSDDAGLGDLESRIQKLKKPPQGNALYARGVALVTSFGFILAGCLVGGYFLGDALAKRFGHELFLLVGLVAGLAAAVVALSKLMRPFLQSKG